MKKVLKEGAFRKSTLRTPSLNEEIISFRLRREHPQSPAFQHTIHRDIIHIRLRKKYPG
jgi:hypothetical protein